MLFPGGSVIREMLVGECGSSDAPMQIVSGPQGRTTVHRVAVPGPAVRSEMHAFLEWFNRTRDDGSMDGLVSAGLAHVWFESIHPFEDGNGRAGRAIVDFALAQDARRSTRLRGLAIAMRRHQETYLGALNSAQRGSGDVTGWLAWSLAAYTEACRDGGVPIEEALDAGPGRFEGGLTTRKYAAITRTSPVTASRHVAEMLEPGLIVWAEGAGGRSTHYNLAIPGWEWRGR